MTDLDLWFSYNQIVVQDAAARDLPEWRPEHSRQGFTRLDDCVCFQTLYDYGFARMSIHWTPFSQSGCDRAIEVPMEIPSGRVAVFAPDDELAAVELTVTAGSYTVTLAQSALGEDEMGVPQEQMHLHLTPRGAGRAASRILVADATLYPPEPLSEPARPIGR